MYLNTPLAVSLKVAWKLTMTPSANEFGKQQGVYIHPHGIIDT